MTQKKAEILLAAVIAARATSLLFSKIAMNGMGIFNLLAARFLMAFVLLAVVFFKRLRHIKRRATAKSKRRVKLLSPHFVVVDLLRGE